LDLSPNVNAKKSRDFSTPGTTEISPASEQVTHILLPSGRLEAKAENQPRPLPTLQAGAVASFTRNVQRVRRFIAPFVSLTFRLLLIANGLSEIQPSP
jgi:hypothetical protein